MADPWQYVSPAVLATATECPVEDVRSNWPRLVEQLELCGINERNVQIGLAGTVAKESASTFRPVREAFWLDEAWRRANLTYYPYYGRGYIQITHRSNYQAYGLKLAALWGANPEHPDFDLVGNPDRALDPTVSAGVSALFFRDTKTLQGYGIVDACRAADWPWVRRLVLGAADPNGVARIERVAVAMGGSPMPTVTYNQSTPPIAQDDGWSCAPTSLRWALTSLGRAPGPTYIEDLLVRDGVVSKEQGLLDASGAQLAAWIGKKGPEYYGDLGFYGNNEPSVTFDGVAQEGTGPGVNGHAYPLLIGGRAWGHWSGVRDYDDDRDVLLLANPSDGWKGVGQTMNREQFDSLGPFSMVRVLHDDLLKVFEQSPEPPPPVPTENPLRAWKSEGLAILDADDRAFRNALRAWIERMPVG